MKKHAALMCSRKKITCLKVLITRLFKSDQSWAVNNKKNLVLLVLTTNVA